MSPFEALVRAYDRLAADGQVPPFGYETRSIQWVLSLNDDGSPAGPPIFIGERRGQKSVGRPIAVPESLNRTVNILPFRIWDNTEYLLGVDANPDPKTPMRHEAFMEHQEELLLHCDDVGATSFLTFLRNWEPEEFERRGWPEEMYGCWVIPCLESDRRRNVWLYDRPAIREALEAAQVAEEEEADVGVCLVTGNRGGIARLHNKIKGVRGTDSTGASLVAFNAKALESYGKEQGGNAPFSIKAAFSYVAALNHFLNCESHCTYAGDTTLVYWADASQAEKIEEAESIFSGLIGARVDEDLQARRVGDILEGIRIGRPLSELAPDLAEGVRFYVLGLAPNSGRLFVRFWCEDNFGEFVSNYQRFLEDVYVEPMHENHRHQASSYLQSIALKGDVKRLPPSLVAKWHTAALTGERYPSAILGHTLARIRATRSITDYRAGILKALLIRNFNKQEAPVALDRDYRDIGYLLGRLFATYERVQYLALGGKVNATIKDKFFSSAMNSPRRVFGRLADISAKHLGKLKRQNPGACAWVEREITQITDAMGPTEMSFPPRLSPDQQAFFGLGYYHQRGEFFKTRASAAETVDELEKEVS